MMIWLALLLFVAGSAFSIVRPFLTQQTDGVVDLQLSTRTDELRTALDAVDRDESAGLVTKTEAEQSRIRIAEDYEAYVAEGEPTAVTGRSSSSHAPTVAAISAIIMGVIAFSTYAVAGAPGFRDHPLDWRIANDPLVEIAHNVDRMEAYLVQNPQDGRAWAMVAPIYFEYESWGKSANAYLSAARYGSFTDTEKSQLLVMATRAMLGESNGIYTDASNQVAEAAARFDPKSVQARFLQTDAATQGVSRDQEISEWEQFVFEFSDDTSGFKVAALERIASLKTGGTTTVEPGARGPNQEQIEAAASLSDEQRSLMVEGMVNRLAARLENSPGDVDGWERLIRSYAALDRKSDAKTALEQARDALVTDANAQERFVALATELNLEP